MKLSEIKGTRVFDVIADIIDPIANIAEDKEVTALFKKENLPEGVSSDQYILQRLKTAIPCLLKRHKADIIAILSLLDDVDTETYADNLTFAKLIKDCAELLQDQAFTAFFPSLVSKGDGNFSG